MRRRSRFAGPPPPWRERRRRARRNEKRARRRCCGSRGARARATGTAAEEAMAAMVCVKRGKVERSLPSDVTGGGGGARGQIDRRRARSRGTQPELSNDGQTPADADGWRKKGARLEQGGGEGEGTRGARARARSGIEPRGSRRDAPEVGGDVKLRAVWSAPRLWRAARTADEDEARMTGGAPEGPGGREAQSVRSDQAAREPIKYPSETDGSRTAKCPVINSGRNRTSVTRRFVRHHLSGLMMILRQAAKSK